ncbi:receptor-like kinase [Trifolium pratense]|uniref:Receptor-like kinase n=1 Tax=Trifolium pratense TaxID=57577 RepID=A0A2K3MSI9_TRIPR|nr:receptor-like kinase [Trifolium pratense]
MSMLFPSSKLPQEYEGLGVRQLREFNLALLGKWCWRLLVDRGGLWFRVLEARYGLEGGRVKAGDSRGSSWWREIARIMDGGRGSTGGWFGESISKTVGDGSDTLFWIDPWLGESPLCERFRCLLDLSATKSGTIVEMASLGWETRGGAWVWGRHLWAWEEEMLGECQALLLGVSFQAQLPERWLWLHDPDHGYSVRDAYQLLTSQDSVILDACYDLVWHKQVPLKVYILAWRLLRDRLPTKANLVSRGILSSLTISCVSGCGEVESAHHLLLSCSIYGSLWALVRSWNGVPMMDYTTLGDHFVQFACVWIIWTERNHRLFGGSPSTCHQLLDKIKLFSYRWLKTTSVSLVSNYHSWWSDPLLCLGLV